MAPKKKEEEDTGKPPLLGRAKNNVTIGIVGIPNVGKSSFFNVLTKLSIPAENFPFCTIDPNTAKVAVPDKRFKVLCTKFKPKSEVPAVLTITDIAGLVRGAAEGAGLGNAFLSHIGAVDAIFHMTRAFEDKDVTHVEESVDPVRDMEIIHEELRLKDLETCQRYIDANQKAVDMNRGGKELKFALNTMLKVKECLDGKNDVRKGKWDGKQIEILNQHLFLTAKPVIYLVNCSKKSFLRRANKWLVKIDEYIKGRGCGDLMIPFSVPYEEELLDAEVNGGMKAKQAAIKENGGIRSALPKIIHKGYDALDLVHYFTAGADECKCWTIRKGTLAPKAAGVIHTDFEKGFIKAAVYKFADFEELGSEGAVKDAGKLLDKGKTYEVQDGDIMHFKFNN